MTTRRNPWTAIRAELRMWRDTARWWNAEAQRTARALADARRETDDLRRELAELRAQLSVQRWMTDDARAYAKSRDAAVRAALADAARADATLRIAKAHPALWVDFLTAGVFPDAPEPPGKPH